MHISRTLAVALGLGFLTAVQASELIGRVVNVHDGDTLTLLVDRHKVRVRLADIDAPELKQAFGRRSKDSLAGMCAGVRARVVEQVRDRYGRTLGRVTCGPYDTNTEQVRRGLAWVFTRYAPKDSPLYAIQTQARIEHWGL